MRKPTLWFRWVLGPILRRLSVEEAADALVEFRSLVGRGMSFWVFWFWTVRWLARHFTRQLLRRVEWFLRRDRTVSGIEWAFGLPYVGQALKELGLSRLWRWYKFGPGPWLDEPDRAEGYHLGFPLLVVRQHHLGHLCGYVAVPPGHPWYGKSYNDMHPYPECHGGATYADSCNERVCHVPAPGDSDQVWWVGFDCAHFMDYSPGMGRLLVLGRVSFRTERGSYKTMDYVMKECRRLAEQAQTVFANATGS